MPQPPYVLLFEEVVPGARPLTILVDDRGAVPLFDSEEKAGAFVASTDLGAGLEPVEVSGPGLVRALESVGDDVDYPTAEPGGRPLRARWEFRGYALSRSRCSLRNLATFGAMITWQ
jgi:hypothetical protein